MIAGLLFLVSAVSTALYLWVTREYRKRGLW